MFQRAQISGYARKAKIANNKNVGNLTRDVKSLVVPYLFTLVGFKPNKALITSSSSSQSKPVTLSDYAKASANANRYFVNKFASNKNFKPEARERGRRRRVPPFNRQLQYFWIFNKSTILKDAMSEINDNPNSVFQAAIGCDKSKGNELEKKKEAFKKDFERYKQNRISGRNYGDSSILNQYYNEANKFYDENDEGGKGGGGSGSA